MKIAAVIPVRNRPELLRKAIFSVQAQTLPLDELIIVDDALTDHTAEVARSMAADDRRIRVIVQPERKMVGAARNVGWRSSGADWIAFLDSDDEWLPEKTERQMALLAKSEAVACFTGLKCKVDHYVHSPPETVSLFDLQRRNVLDTASTSIVRNSALAAVGGFDKHLPTCVDWDMWIKLRMLGELSILGDPMIYYDRGGGDRMSRNLENVLKGHQMMLSRTLSDVHGIIRRSRVRAHHHARMAQILHDNFESPIQALSVGAPGPGGSPSTREQPKRTG